MNILKRSFFVLLLTLFFAQGSLAVQSGFTGQPFNSVGQLPARSVILQVVPGTTDTSFPTTGAPGTSDTSFPTTGTPGTSDTSFPTTGTPGTTDTSFPTTGTPETTTTTATGTPGTTDTSFPTTGTPETTTTTGVDTGTPGTDTSFPTTGETTAGETTAGETTAGETSTTGDTTTTTGETTASEDSTTGETPSTTGGSSADKEKLKHKWEPIFYLDFDFASYLINLTPQSIPENAVKTPSLVRYNSTKATGGDALVVDDFRSGFQKSSGGNVSAGVGGQIHWWYANASGIQDALWANIGIMPVVGTSTYSKRYVKTYSEAHDLPGRGRNPSASDLLTWDLGDSVKAVNNGGLLFVAGIGLNPAGLGLAGFASGAWETYVEKVSDNEVYVKISKADVKKLALFAHATVISLQVEDFGVTDDGFSFVYDLTTEAGRRAYEDMIHGNVLASEKIAKELPRNHVERAPLAKVESFRTLSTGSLASVNFNIPILWNYRYSKGNVKSFTTSQLYLDRHTAQVNYGVYTNEKSNRIFFRHTEQGLNFYGAAYTLKDWETKDSTRGIFGQYHYSYHKQDSTTKNFTFAINNMLKKTGIEFLRAQVPDVGRLGYAGFALALKMSEANTLNMIDEAKSIDRASFISRAVSPIRGYVNVQNDPYELCPKAEDSEAPPSYEAPDCETYLTAETSKAAGKMYDSLREMGKQRNKNDAAFAVAYGEFGEGMAKNLFAFQYAKRIAGPDLMLSYLIQGTRLSLYMREWKTDVDGNWIPVKYSGDKRPVDPRFIHSEFRQDLLTRNSHK